MICEVYDYDSKNLRPTHEMGERVIQAVKKIQQNAAKKKTLGKEKIVIKELETDWKIDSINTDYMSKLFEVSSDYSYENYEVSIYNQVIPIKITNEKNEEIQNFKEEEKFKILIPIQEMRRAGNFSVSVEAKIKTFPLKLGSNDMDGEKFEYILTRPEIEKVSINLMQSYEKQIEENSKEEEIQIPEDNNEKDDQHIDNNQDKKEENDINTEKIEHTKEDQMNTEKQVMLETKKLPRTGF